MLVLTRKLGEEIVIDNDIVVTVLEIQGGRIRLGVAAPKEIPVRRAELKAAAAWSNSGNNLTSLPLATSGA